MTLPIVGWLLLALLDPGVAQLYGYLFDDFNPESFQGRDFLRPVRQQPNPPQVQIRQNLRPDANLALDMLAIVVERSKGPSAMEAQSGSLANSLDRESLRSLMQIDQRAQPFIRDAPQ